VLCQYPEGHELKFFERMVHLDLLIIDDFGIKRLEGQQQNDFEQIIDDRYHKKSLILSSQLAVADWYGIFSNEMLVEACLDRIINLLFFYSDTFNPNLSTSTPRNSFSFFILSNLSS